eukprot:UN12074
MDISSVISFKYKSKRILSILLDYENRYRLWNYHHLKCKLCYNLAIKQDSYHRHRYCCETCAILLRNGFGPQMNINVAR